MMVNEPLQIGDLVEILSLTERPAGRPAAARRYGLVVAAPDENSRVAIQVQDRRYPLHIPREQLHGLGDSPHHAPERPDAAANGLGQARLTVQGARYGLGNTRRLEY